MIMKLQRERQEEQQEKHQVVKMEIQMEHMIIIAQMKTHQKMEKAIPAKKKAMVGKKKGKG